MNVPIARLFGVVVLLFALLVGFDLALDGVRGRRAEQQRAQPPHAARRAARSSAGRILADDGTVLARSVPAAGGTYTRSIRPATCSRQPVGYSIAAQGRSAGLERSRGRRAARPADRARARSSSSSARAERATTCTRRSIPRPSGSRCRQLAGRAGAVVALDPQTGAVKVMVANPGYDNNHAATPTATRDLDRCQPLDAGRLPAGLDVQGRDRDRGDRQRQVHAQLDRQRQTRRR